MPLGKDIDAKLIIGAVIFGIGWAFRRLLSRVLVLFLRQLEQKSTIILLLA